MTQNEINIAIEKNRRVLLRLVLTWLIAGNMMLCMGDRTLPRRFGAWVNEIIWKLEKSTFYLRCAAYITHDSERIPALPEGPINISSAVARLKNLLNLLRALNVRQSEIGNAFAGSLRQFHTAWSNIRFIDFKKGDPLCRAPP